MNIEHLIRKVANWYLSRYGNDVRLLKEGGLATVRKVFMDPAFDYKKYETTPHPYLSKWGYKYSAVENEYYAQTSGIRSDYYLPYTFFHNLLCTYLDKYDYYQRCWQDRNMYYKLIGAYRQNKRQPFELAKSLVYNMGGTYYNENDEVISKEEALRIVVDYPGDLFMKPCVETQWMDYGDKLYLKASERTEEQIRTIMEQEDMNFLFQVIVKQHHALASLNESSVNTVKVDTFRQADGKIRVLYALQYVGEKGAHVDSPNHGGGILPLGLDGKYSDRKVRRYHHIDTFELDENATNEVPYFDRLKELALYLHENLPYFGFVEWSLSVTEEGMPVLIDYHTIPHIENKQLVSGPVWTKEELDEFMKHLSTYHVCYKVHSNLFFTDKRNYEKTKEHLED